MHPLRLAAALPVGALALTLAATPAAAWPDHGQGHGHGHGHGQGHGDTWHHRSHDGHGSAAERRPEERQRSTVSVTGHGESTAAPDMAVITLGVTVQAPGAAEAMRENTARQQVVIDTLKSRGIEARDIQTSGLNLTPVQDFSREGRPPVVTGYQATNMVTVRIRDLPRLGEALDALVGAGANEIHGVGFQRENIEDAEDDARARAVENAHLRAGIMAKAAGMELGRLVSMTDVAGSRGPQPMMRAMAMDSAAAAPVPIEAGELSIAADVTMTWELRPARRGDGRGQRGDDMGRHGMGGMGDLHGGRMDHEGMGVPMHQGMGAEGRPGPGTSAGTADRQGAATPEPVSPAPAGTGEADAAAATEPSVTPPASDAGAATNSAAPANPAPTPDAPAAPAPGSDAAAPDAGAPTPTN